MPRGSQQRACGSTTTRGAVQQDELGRAPIPVLRGPGHSLATNVSLMFMATASSRPRLGLVSRIRQIPAGRVAARRPDAYMHSPSGYFRYPPTRRLCAGWPRHSPDRSSRSATPRSRMGHLGSAHPRCGCESVAGSRVTFTDPDGQGVMASPRRPPLSATRPSEPVARTRG